MVKIVFSYKKSNKNLEIYCNINDKLKDQLGKIEDLDINSIICVYEEKKNI